VIRPPTDPISPAGATAVLTGNLAPRGCVMKPSAADPRLLRHRGPVIAFEDYNHMAREVERDDLDVTPDHILVLKNAGPKGGPGMPEWGMLPIPKRLLQQGVRDMVRISDARMSGTAAGTVVLHVCPEAAVGGPLGLVRDGDVIELDVPRRTLNVRISDEEMTRRRLIDRLLVSAGWKVGANGTSTEQVGQEIEVLHQPTPSGKGKADYVLWGDNGKPLGVVEGKKTAVDSEAGRTQAKCYADGLEKMFGQRPAIFYTNGHDIGLWNDASGEPPRKLFGFYSQDSLEYLHYQRANREALTKTAPNPAIAGRMYQIEAIKRVAERFAAKMAERGIGNDDRVVDYDSLGLSSAGRAWWMLRLFGHAEVALLDGGLVKWRAEGRKLETAQPAIPPRRFVAHFDPALVRDKRALLADLARAGPREQVVDARASGRFDGSAEETWPGRRRGHIPGSRNLPVDWVTAPRPRPVSRSSTTRRLRPCIAPWPGCPRTTPIMPMGFPSRSIGTPSMARQPPARR